MPCVKAGGTKTVELQMHLVVTQPPQCTVVDTVIALESVSIPWNERDTYDVNDVLVESNAQAINISCDPTIRPYPKVKLRLLGKTAAYSDLVLQTSYPGLGLKFFYDNQPFVFGPGGGIDVDLEKGSHIGFHIYLVQDNKFPFSYIAFSASATMVMELL